MALTNDDKDFIQLAINNGMTAAVAEHAKTCSVKNDYYGNGKPGTKLEVHDLKQDVTALKQCKAGTLGFFKAVAITVIGSVLTTSILVVVGLKVLPKPSAETKTETVSHGSQP